MTLSITTLSITTFSITTLSMMTHSITTLSITGLYVTLSLSETQHKQHSALLCHYDERHYAECRVFLIIMLNVVKLSVGMLSVMAPIPELLPCCDITFLTCLGK
jgi:hypothetical protein